MNLRIARIALWALVGVVALAGLVIALRPPPTLPQSTETAMTPVGGAFTLTGTDGKPFASASLKGKPFAVFFGFTHCPDVCPNTLARLARLRRTIGTDDAFAILFVSVDPTRDTPAEMARYAAAFNTPIIALTGSEQDIAKVKTTFGIYSTKVPQTGADYSVDHTATVFLMDSGGKFKATITPDEGDPPALAKLRRLTS
ncbi:MAG: SCO family protein [Sphingomicrobium sp.]